MEDKDDQVNSLGRAPQLALIGREGSLIVIVHWYIDIFDDTGVHYMHLVSMLCDQIRATLWGVLSPGQQLAQATTEKLQALLDLAQESERRRHESETVGALQTQAGTALYGQIV